MVLSVSRAMPTEQVVNGQHIEITAAGIRLRPWRVRWATPAQLDELAGAAGFVHWPTRPRAGSGEPFADDSPCHVSVYERR